MSRPALYIVMMIVVAVGIAIAIIVFAEMYFPEVGQQDTEESQNVRIVGPIQVALEDPGDFEVMLQSRPLVVLDSYNRPKSVQVRMIVPGLNVANAICLTHPRLSDEVQLYFQEHHTRFADAQKKQEVNIFLMNALKRRLDPRAVSWSALVDPQETATEQAEADIYECRGEVARRVVKRVYQ